MTNHVFVFRYVIDASGTYRHDVVIAPDNSTALRQMGRKLHLLRPNDDLSEYRDGEEYFLDSVRVLEDFRADATAPTCPTCGAAHVCQGAFSVYTCSTCNARFTVTSATDLPEPPNIDAWEAEHFRVDIFDGIDDVDSEGLSLNFNNATGICTASGGDRSATGRTFAEAIRNLRDI